MSLLLIDLDGTLREPLSGRQYFQHSQDQRVGIAFEWAWDWIARHQKASLKQS